MKHDESHGWTWDAIGFDNREFLYRKLPDSVQNGGLVENMFNDTKKVFYSVNPICNPVQICILNVINESAKSISVDSFYPIVEGIENEITILDTYVWENNLEGEVIACFNDAVEISFFSPFYCKEFENIQEKTVKVFLAGIADSVNVVNDEDDLTINKGPVYEMQLNDFLAKSTDKTECDFGSVTVSFKSATVFLPTDYASYFQFRGQIQTIETVFLFDIEILKIKLCIVKADDKELNVYIYVSKNRVKYSELKTGCNIEGIVTLRGYIDYKKHQSS
jgi:hypothetical protein